MKSIQETSTCSRSSHRRNFGEISAHPATAFEQAAAKSLAEFHVICALKHNRKFKKQGAKKARQLSQLARYIRNREFKRTTVNSSDSSTHYWVHSETDFKTLSDVIAQHRDDQQEICGQLQKKQLAIRQSNDQGNSHSLDLTSTPNIGRSIPLVKLKILLRPKTEKQWTV